MVQDKCTRGKENMLTTEIFVISPLPPLVPSSLPPFSHSIHERNAGGPREERQKKDMQSHAEMRPTMTSGRGHHDGHDQ